MLQEDQIIYQKIGKLLWSIMPLEAKEIIYLAQLYVNVTQAGLIGLIMREKREVSMMDLKIPFRKLNTRLENHWKPCKNSLCFNKILGLNVR